MTILTGTYASGYKMTTPFQEVYVSATGYLKGGLGSGTITAYTVISYGRILHGVYLGDGGTLVNGSPTNPAALIEGSGGAGGGAVWIRRAVGTVANYGSIVALGNRDNAGVYLGVGGNLSNGSSGDTTALIKGGGYGVWLRAAGTVTNFGAIEGSIAYAAHSSGVYAEAGGAVVNGSGDDPAALIRGTTGVDSAAVATVTNFGTIEGVSETSGSGVALAGGAVTNGTAIDTVALIKGGNGVSITGQPATVVNLGAIEATNAGGAGITLGDGGKVTNGSSTDRGALISGDAALLVSGAAGTVVNFGTIRSSGGDGDYGVSLGDGGALKNGAINDRTSLIEGYGGVRLTGASGVNFGTIAGLGSDLTAGVYLAAGASLVNGGAPLFGTVDASALIDGYFGVHGYGEKAAPATLTNYGTISGAAGVAFLGNAYTTLVVEAGAVFDGAVVGVNSVLDLASGVGTISGLGGDLTVSASMPTTVFQEFGTVEIGAAGLFTLTGTGTVAAGKTLDVVGTLSAAGALDVTGAFDLTGVLEGPGRLALSGGAKATFGAGAGLAIAKVGIGGATTVVTVAAPALTYAGVWTQVAGALTVSAGDRMNFTGTGDAFTGTLTGAGTVAFTGGSDTLNGVTLSAATTLISGAAVTLEAATTISGVLSVTTTNLIVAAAGTTLIGGGSLALSNIAANRVIGASAAATLTNVNDKILGAGRLGGGSMILVNDAGGIIDANLSTALVIDTGTATITNAGLIEATGAGGATIDSAVENTGTLTASGGNLTVLGAVSGVGKVRISGATADFASTFAESVDFFGTTGVLELGKSQTYTGAITGFSTAGKTTLDLDDIAFATGTTTATYAGTAASGVLTVKDGTHTAKIKFIGNYTASTWTLSSDGHGGTMIIDPAGGAPTHGFIAAAAGLGAFGSISPTAEPWRAPPTALGLPRVEIA